MLTKLLIVNLHIQTELGFLSLNSTRSQLQVFHKIHMEILILSGSVIHLKQEEEYKSCRRSFSIELTLKLPGAVPVAARHSEHHQEEDQREEDGPGHEVDHGGGDGDGDVAEAGHHHSVLGHPPLLTNHRSVFRSRDLSQPITGQHYLVPSDVPHIR